MASNSKKTTATNLYALSLLVFLISDVQGGVGPYIAVYLKSVLNWSLSNIGFALAMYNIASLTAQIPSGLLIDKVHFKRLLVGLCAVMISVGCYIIINSAHLMPILFAQSLIGVAASIIPPAIAAITLGLVGRAQFPARLSINGTFNHAGNVFNAMVTGITTFFFGVVWILYTDIFFSLISLVPLICINKNDIDNEVAREAPENNGSTSYPIKKLLLTPSILYFGIAVALFTFSNSFQLPLLGQKLALQAPKYAATYMTISIISAQLVMIAVAFFLSLFIDKIGRKPLFLTCYFVLMVRAILYVLFTQPIFLLCNQVLDGIGAGIFSIVAIVITSDLAKDSGRFNFMQGLIIFCISIGSALSNVMGGLVAERVGINASFLVLSFIALLGGIFYSIFMPETKDKKFIAL